MVNYRLLNFDGLNFAKMGDYLIFDKGHYRELFILDNRSTSKQNSPVTHDDVIAFFQLDYSKVISGGRYFLRTNSRISLDDDERLTISDEDTTLEVDGFIVSEHPLKGSSNMEKKAVAGLLEQLMEQNGWDLENIVILD